MAQANEEAGMTSTIEHVNDDFSKAASVNIDGLAWLPSPMAGVERKLLDRVGGEVARATSVVRFMAGHSFSEHTHGGGEECFVLAGVFSDSSGDYSQGWYVRNPPGSSHKPHSGNGCEIFVKLCQMREEGELAIAIDSNAMAFTPVVGRLGFFEKKLFSASGWYEEVAIEKITAECAAEPETFADGAEILVLEGALHDGAVTHQATSWARYPYGAVVTLSTEHQAVYLIKRGIVFPQET